MSSMYQTFVPTFLYIKKHTITGKLYFGKTIKNPEKYNGSGKYWLRHIKCHGKEHIETLWYCLYTDKQILMDAAISFSKLWNVANSSSWLNLKEETGVDGGGTKGRKLSKKEILDRSKKWIIKSPAGKIFNICNLQKFCRENDLDHTIMRRIYKGKVKHNKLWQCKPENIEYNFYDVSQLKSSIRSCILIDPNGETHQVNNIRQFSIKNKLRPNAISSLVTGKRKYHLGWKLQP
jgi:hypothetical protein